MIKSDRGINVTIAGLEVLLADSIQDVGSLGANLEEVRGSAAGSVLGSEQKREKSTRDLHVREFTNEGLRLDQVVRRKSLLGSLEPLLRVDHLLDPGIHDTGDVTSSSHADLGLGSTLGELFHSFTSSPLAVPCARVGEDDGEVDQVEGSGDEIVVISNLLNGRVGHVIASESAKRNGAHQLAEFVHEGHRLASSILGDLKESGKIALILGFLSREIAFERPASEKIVETLAVIDVRLSIQEDPAVLSQDLGSDIDDTRLDILGGVENLSGEVAS